MDAIHWASLGTSIIMSKYACMPACAWVACILAHISLSNNGSTWPIYIITDDGDDDGHDNDDSDDDDDDCFKR